MVYPGLIWLASSILVLIAVDFSLSVVELCTSHPDHQSRVDISTAMAAWDGRWQVDIIRHGYQQRINSQNLNPAAFPPLYPLLGAALCKFGLTEEVALLLVSNGAFLAFITIFYCYCRARGHNKSQASLAAFLVSISPFSYFFHMAYTESLFCFFAALFLFGILAKWPPVLLAILVMCSGATRVVGVTLIPILFIASLQYYTHDWLRWPKAVCFSLLGAAGFVAFMVHLNVTQGNPLAMFHAQEGWTIRVEGSFLQQVIHAVSGQPLWDAYDSDCRCFWGNNPPADLPMFNMQFWNPIVLVLAVALMFIGWKRCSMTWFELMYCFFVIAVPYFTQGYRICLHSQSRYALAAFPLAMVVAWCLKRLDVAVTWVVIATCAALLFGNTAMFIGWYFNY